MSNVRLNSMSLNDFRCVDASDDMVRGLKLTSKSSIVGRVSVEVASVIGVMIALTSTVVHETTGETVDWATVEPRASSLFVLFASCTVCYREK